MTTESSVDAGSRDATGPSPAPSDAKIVVKDFLHRFKTADGDVQATDRINLTIREGEVVTLVGPSGCGKTTLLKAIAGFIKPTEGAVYCNGKLVKSPHRERGVVFQELAILPWRTVRRNIAHGLEIAGVDKAERDQKVASMIEMMGLSGFEDRYPHELSGGMKQRVAVARTWIADPEIILMDEPFAAVDAMTRLTLQEELGALCAESGKTVFFITHSVDEAVFLGDRVLVMSRRPGRIKKELVIPRHTSGGRDWESFKADPDLRATVDETLHLVREERMSDKAPQSGAASPG
jgi:NitT/TauT family transport system ATP-binding protein